MTLLHILLEPQAENWIFGSTFKDKFLELFASSQSTFGGVDGVG